MRAMLILFVTLFAASLADGTWAFAQDDAATGNGASLAGGGYWPFGRGLGFVDEDGDGINDRLQDSDGDGVINALDPDSKLYRNPAQRIGRGLGFVDEDGDGINDRLQDSDGDGVINALDPDSKFYRNPAARGSMRGGEGMRRGGGRR